MEPVDIGAEIDTILLLLHNKIKHNVTVVRDYAGGPALGSRHALNQVWVNLINNALQAMNYAGTLTVKTAREGKYIVVRIIDTAPGSTPRSGSGFLSLFSPRKNSAKASVSGWISANGSSSSSMAKYFLKVFPGIRSSRSGFWPPSKSHKESLCPLKVNLTSFVSTTSSSYLSPSGRNFA